MKVNEAAKNNQPVCLLKLRFGTKMQSVGVGKDDFGGGSRLKARGERRAEVAAIESLHSPSRLIQNLPRLPAGWIIAPAVIGNDVGVNTVYHADLQRGG
jgi:hypothetical protein